MLSCRKCRITLQLLVAIFAATKFQMYDPPAVETLSLLFFGTTFHTLILISASTALESTEEMLIGLLFYATIESLS